MSKPVDTELIVIEEGKALELFSKEGGLDFIIDDARALVDGFKHDITTDAGRKKTAALAYKVAQFKVRLDGMGKDLVTEWKAKAKLVDNNRKHIRDELDALKAVARQPLSDYEEAKKAEEEARRLAAEIEEAHTLALAENIILDQQAEIARHKEEARQKEEAERVEAERVERETRIREEEAARVRAEEEEKATEAARIAEESRLKAVREKEAAEARVLEEERARVAEEAEAVELAMKVERDRIHAEERAKIEQEMAVKRAKEEEAARIKELEEAKAEAQRAKEENVRHRGKIHKAAKTDLMALGLDESKAVQIVKAIAAGEIKNVSMNY